jgi:hypothetical protein
VVRWARLEKFGGFTKFTMGLCASTKQKPHTMSRFGAEVSHFGGYHREREGEEREERGEERRGEKRREKRKLAGRLGGAVGPT